MTRRFAKLCLSLLYYVLEVACFQVCRRLAGSSQKLVTLTYHQVTHAQEPSFCQQLRMVQKYGTGVFADFSSSAPGKFVAITFDDFLADALGVAGRALVEARMPSTWFVVTNALGGRVNWIRTSHFENAGAPVASSDDLARLDPNLFRIASHTCSHSPLPRLPADVLDAELRDSRSQLEALCPNTVTSLSFPYGEYDVSVLERCASAGYQFAFANVPVWSRFSCGGILRGRVPVEPDDWPIEFWLKLRGGYDWLALPGYLRHQMIPSWRNRRITHDSNSTVTCAPPPPAPASTALKNSGPWIK